MTLHVGLVRIKGYANSLCTVDFTSLGTPGPVAGKFMVGAVGDFTLQSMARTNHKFPGYGGSGHSK